MQEVKFSVAFVNALLQYLSTKPYAEVQPIIDEIKSQAEAQLKAPDAAGGTD